MTELLAFLDSPWFLAVVVPLIAVEIAIGVVLRRMGRRVQRRHDRIPHRRVAHWRLRKASEQSRLRVLRHDR